MWRMATHSAHNWPCIRHIQLWWLLVYSQTPNTIPEPGTPASSCYANDEDKPPPAEVVTEHVRNTSDRHFKAQNGDFQQHTSESNRPAFLMARPAAMATEKKGAESLPVYTHTPAPPHSIISTFLLPARESYADKKQRHWYKTGTLIQRPSNGGENKGSPGRWRKYSGVRGSKTQAPGESHPRWH